MYTVSSSPEKCKTDRRKLKRVSKLESNRILKSEYSYYSIFMESSEDHLSFVSLEQDEAIDWRVEGNKAKVRV